MFLFLPRMIDDKSTQINQCKTSGCNLKVISGFSSRMKSSHFLNLIQIKSKHEHSFSPPAGGHSQEMGSEAYHPFLPIKPSKLASTGVQRLGASHTSLDPHSSALGPASPSFHCPSILDIYSGKQPVWHLLSHNIFGILTTYVVVVKLLSVSIWETYTSRDLWVFIMIKIGRQI